MTRVSIHCKGCEAKGDWTKRTIIDVAYDKAVGLWHYGRRDGRRFASGTKVDAVGCGRRLALHFQPSQLVIRGKNGRIQTEHTYPRASDPRRSKG